MRAYLSQKVNFEKEIDKKNVLKTIVNILDRNKKEVFYIYISLGPKKGHALGIYMNQAGSIELSDANTEIIRFNDSQQFIDWLSSKNCISLSLVNCNKVRIALLKFNDVKRLKRRAILSFLWLILEPIAVFYPIKKLINKIYNTPSNTALAAGLIITLVILSIILLHILVFTALEAIWASFRLSYSHKTNVRIQTLKNTKNQSWKNACGIQSIKASTLNTMAKVNPIKKITEAKDTGTKDEIIKIQDNHSDVNSQLTDIPQKPSNNPVI